MLFWKDAPSGRLNKRVMGTLKDAALKKANRMIDRNGSLNMSGIYGDRDRREGFCLRLTIKVKGEAKLATGE